MAVATNNPLAYLGEQIEAWKQAGTYQRLRVLESESAAESRFDGREVINLASNNYLGLTTHPKLREAAIEATRRLRRRLGRGPHHLRHHDAPHAARGAHRALQERRSVRGVSIRLRRQCRHGGGDPHAGGPHHLRRAEPRQHHRRLPAVESQDPRLSAQGRGDSRQDPGRNWQAGRGASCSSPTASFRWMATSVRCPALVEAAERHGAIMMIDDAHSSGVLGTQRARHRRSLRPARTRAHPGGHAVESDRRAGRLRVRQPRPDRVSVSPRAAVSVFHLASAGGGGLPAWLLSMCWSRSRSASKTCGTTRAISSKGWRRPASTRA